MEDIPINSSQRNVVLNEKLDIVSKVVNVKDMLKILETATTTFPICPDCHMPAIPGTPCIVR